MTDPIVKARSAVETIAFGMDPLLAVTLLEKAKPLIDQHMSASFIPGAAGPDLGAHPSKAIVIAAIAPSLGAGMDETHYRVHMGRLKALMDCVADDCRMRADLVRQWVDHNARRILAGNAITLRDLPNHVVDRLLTAVIPEEGDVDVHATIAMLASLKSARLDEKGLEVLRCVSPRLDKTSDKALYDGLDPWTRDWVGTLLWLPDETASAG